MHPTDARALTAPILRWYRRHRRDLPWRRTRDPYRVWISEIMLQQTTVRMALPYYRRFLRRFPNLRALARARLPRVLAAWSGLGYYGRARRLHEAARRIRRIHDGRFPRAKEQILALPGIGRYTAGAILSIVFGEKEPVLDGNVARVLSRLFLLRGEAAGRQRLWGLAAGLVEATSSPGDLNQALMELGATICSPFAPACPRCPVRRHCAARAAGLERSIPLPRRRRPPVTIRQTIALVERDGRLLMQRRRRTNLMEGLWEFPTFEPSGRDALSLRPLARITTVRHSITYRRLLIEVRRATLLAEPRGGIYRWVTPARALRLPVSSLVPKILRTIDQARI